MLSLLVTATVALVIGRLAGGRCRHLATLPVRGARWLVAAVALQVAGALLLPALGVPDGVAYPLGLVMSLVPVLVFLTLNRTLVGLGLVALGLAGNALVIAANGAMPVRLEAAARAGAATAALVADGRHEVARDGTRLALLGDVVPVPWPWRGEVLSPGDVLVLAGVAQLLVVGMRAPEEGAQPSPGTGDRAAGAT